MLNLPTKDVIVSTPTAQHRTCRRLAGVVGRGRTTSPPRTFGNGGIGTPESRSRDTETNSSQQRETMGDRCSLSAEQRKTMYTNARTHFDPRPLVGIVNHSAFLFIKIFVKEKKNYCQLEKHGVSNNWEKKKQKC